MNTTEFAAELNTTARTARKFLRADARSNDKAIPGKGSRWDIAKKDLPSLRKRFNAWTKIQDEDRAARAAKKAEDAKKAEAEADTPDEVDAPSTDA